MIAKRMRADSMANEVVRSVQAAVKDAAATHVPGIRRQRNGDGIPLFAWLRAAKRYAKESPVLHITQQSEPPPRVGALLSRVQAAAEVVRRINRASPMTATQLRMLHEAVISRYSGNDSRRDPLEWVAQSPFSEIYAGGSYHLRLEVTLIRERAKVNPYAASAAAILASPRLTDALLMAHLYAANKPDLLNRI
jgi:hypothetical protein